ncbi:hypothetical protein BH09SUM1_BH09SUM1_18560 [soil metagenome]
MGLLKSLIHSLLWGVSIALSWTWGLGLFFSVQISLLFGLKGLLAFAIPNSLGLILFGLLTHGMAKKHEEGRAFERHFFKTSHSLRFIIIAYQLCALALTFFAILHYLFEPSGTALLLGALLIFGAALLLGECFDIGQIRWSHAAMFVPLIVCGVLVHVLLNHYFLNTIGTVPDLGEPHLNLKPGSFLGYLIPMVTGLLLGPWLDIQQWQRAIQIHREKGSIKESYFAGAIIFFGILILHGTLALVVANSGQAVIFTAEKDGLFHGKDIITRFLFGGSGASHFTAACYFIFIFLCIITTLDSGYIALKWYLAELTRKSEHLIFTIIPENLIKSPAPVMFVALLIGMIGARLDLQLEYFMSFYASFSVGYSIVFLFRSTYKPQFTNFTQTTLFAVAIFSLGLFGVGYFQQYWICMALGAVIPFIHGIVVISSRAVADDMQKAIAAHDSGDRVPIDSISGKAAEKAARALEMAISRLDPKVAEKFNSVIQKIEPTAAHALATVLQAIQPHALAPGEFGPGALSLSPASELDDDIAHASGHFEGKWFTFTLMVTYQDTNSVGNTYFGMYPLWVGKVREMFFRACMPGFDLKKTSFFILTRSFEHKFNQESREFDFVTIKVRIESFNRKFSTLEHEIFNQNKQLLGKGKQVLMFVDAKSYQLIDLPTEMKTAFLPHVWGDSPK